MAFFFLWYPFLFQRYSSFPIMQIWCLMTSSVVQVQWCDKKLRISLPIMKQCYWNLAGMLHPTKYNRWYTFWCCYGNMLVSSLLPLQNEILPFAIQQGINTWSYLKHMPVPPSLGLLFNIFNSIFCPVQLPMIIFDVKEEGTETKHVAYKNSFHECNRFFSISMHWRMLKPNLGQHWTSKSCTPSILTQGVVVHRKLPPPDATISRAISGRGPCAFCHHR